MDIAIERVHEFIEELREMYQRDEDQAILQNNMEKARHALAGKEACERLKNYLSMRSEMDANRVRVLSTRKRA
jgi:hypothetical protein